MLLYMLKKLLMPQKKLQYMLKIYNNRQKLLKKQPKFLLNSLNPPKLSQNNFNNKKKLLPNRFLNWLPKLLQVIKPPLKLSNLLVYKPIFLPTKPLKQFKLLKLPMKLPNKLKLPLNKLLMPLNKLLRLLNRLKRSLNKLLLLLQQPKMLPMVFQKKNNKPQRKDNLSDLVLLMKQLLLLLNLFKKHSNKLMMLLLLLMMPSLLLKRLFKHSQMPLLQVKI